MNTRKRRPLEWWAAIRTAELEHLGAHALLDMLRYDSARVLEVSRWTVLRLDNHAPTRGRWESFGVRSLLIGSSREEIGAAISAADAVAV